MTDYQEIYNQQAEQYEQLVAREDYPQNILPALAEIIPLEGLTVVEFGAGTGRLTCLLAPVVQYIYAFDRSAHMLEVARAKLAQTGRENWQLEVRDHRQVPVEDRTADMAIAGWSICYLVVENPETWQAELDKALGEMQRVLKPGGAVILLETLGTGVEQPEVPEHLRAYYDYLESRGFHRSWFRTDYCFPDWAEAESSTRFFFGEPMVAQIREEAGGIILPECTGLWWYMPEEGAQS